MNTMKCWKWTRSDYRTVNDTLWGEGVEHSVSEWTGKLCTGGVLHAYQDPRLAVLVGPIYGGYDSHTGIFWEAEAGGRLVIGSDMIGCETLKTVRRVEPPAVTVKQRVEIAVRCGLATLPDHEREQTWRKWAEKWLSGEDRSYESANTSALGTSHIAAADAAHAAAAVTGTTNPTYAIYTAFAPAHTTAHDVYAIYTSAHAISYAAFANLDIVDIIHQVCGAAKEEVQPCAP